IAPRSTPRFNSSAAWARSASTTFIRPAASGRPRFSPAFPRTAATPRSAAETRPASANSLAPADPPGARGLSSDLTRHPDADGFPQNHPLMRSFLGVPVIGRSGILDTLYLTERVDGAVAKRVTVAVDIASPLPSCLSTVERMEQILVNVVADAVQ